MAEEEVAKLQKHLALLRQEYVKMQQKLADTERRCAVLAARASVQGSTKASVAGSEDTFISRLLEIVAELYQQEQYSDLKVMVGETTLNAHKFVLAARSDAWSLANLASTSKLDLSDAKPEVAMAMLRWAYTDDLELSENDAFLIDLMKLANRFQLQLLRERCEKGVMSSVNVRNCIRFYQTAEELDAITLMNYCGEIIASHWDDLRKEDFSTMSAPLLFKMIKSKTNFPLHKAIKVEREDVVFLYLIEMDSQLPGKLNELDNNGDLALDLALSRKLESIATTLVNNKADVDMVDQSGWSLLHKAIQRGDEFASTFLIRHLAQVNAATVGAVETPLHLVCSFSPKKHSGEVMSGMARIAEALLKTGANPNMQNSKGRTPLQEAVVSGNELVFNQLLQCKQLDLELKDHEGSTALWLALQYITVSSDANVNPFEDDAPVVENGTLFDENSFAAQLIRRGSNPDAPDTATENCLMQRATGVGSEAAALFLATHGAKVNHANKWGETPLHTACRCGLAGLTAELLHQGANPNLQTQKALPDEALAQGVSLQSPLHMAIIHNHPDVVSVILEQKANALHATNNLQIIPDFSLKDSMDQTVLGLALWTGMHTIAAQLLGSGASINDTMSNGQTLLHMAIRRQDSKSALFLLEHQADINVKTQEGETALQLAISNQLPLVVDAICTRGADMSVVDERGHPPLWLALENGLEDIASTLVRHGCDATSWSSGPSGCQQTLLHRAVDENNEVTACFLIRSGCDVNSPRRPGLNGEGDEEARDGQSPLHLAGRWGLEEVVQCLLEFGANVNTQLLAGAKVNELTKHRQTALHLAAQQDLAAICSVLLENGVDFTAVDENGNNALHLAVMQGRLNNVRALLTESNIDAEAFNLRGQSPMHVLGQYGKENAAAIFELFLECMPEYPLDKPDNEGNTVLLLAYMKGNANLCRAIVRSGARMGLNNNQGINIFNYQVATKQLLFRLLDMLSKEPPWCDGSNCYECAAKFGVTTRKHHCRHCGRLLCHKCSIKEIPIIKFDLNKPVRVCDICFDVLTLGGLS
ncbi:rabankyrin-5-like isoform X3 [Salvelinus alpinus]|uniref:rabankyrin-5-like isoform X3 n=1 Tax=Salvelinus alpinus TaxID=8036 RepID=UPI0039FD2C16